VPRARPGQRQNAVAVQNQLERQLDGYYLHAQRAAIRNDCVRARRDTSGSLCRSQSARGRLGLDVCVDGGMSTRQALALALGLLVLGGLVVLDIELMRKPKRSMSKVAIGTRDEIYFSNSAWRSDAEALGHALQQTGFFRDAGATVRLSKEHGVTAVWFVLHDGAWDQGQTV